MLTCSLFITDLSQSLILYIDSLQPLVYYWLNSAVSVYTPPPPYMSDKNVVKNSDFWTYALT